MFTVVGEYGEPGESGESENQSLNRRTKKYLPPNARDIEIHLTLSTLSRPQSVPRVELSGSFSSKAMATRERVAHF